MVSGAVVQTLHGADAQDVHQPPRTCTTTRLPLLSTLPRTAPSAIARAVETAGRGAAENPRSTQVTGRTAPSPAGQIQEPLSGPEGAPSDEEVTGCCLMTGLTVLQEPHLGRSQVASSFAHGFCEPSDGGMGWHTRHAHNSGMKPHDVPMPPKTKPLQALGTKTYRGQ